LRYYSVERRVWQYERTCLLLLVERTRNPNQRWVLKSLSVLVIVRVSGFYLDLTKFALLYPVLLYRARALLASLSCSCTPDIKPSAPSAGWLVDGKCEPDKKRRGDAGFRIRNRLVSPNAPSLLSSENNALAQALPTRINASFLEDPSPAAKRARMCSYLQEALDLCDTTLALLEEDDDTSEN
jgi:hypothetical protein